MATKSWIAGAFIVGAGVGLALSAIAAPGALDIRPPANRGADEVMALLARKERAVERREVTLVAREADLHAAEEHVESRLAELQRLREEVRARLSDLDAEHEREVKGLVKMFESMKPAAAAAVLVGTEDTVALEVLRRMQNKKAGKILEQMPVNKAARFADAIGGPALSGGAQ